MRLFYLLIGALLGLIFSSSASGAEAPEQKEKKTYLLVLPARGPNLQPAIVENRPSRLQRDLIAIDPLNFAKLWDYCGELGIRVYLPPCLADHIPVKPEPPETRSSAFATRPVTFKIYNDEPLVTPASLLHTFRINLEEVFKRKIHFEPLYLATSLGRRTVGGLDGDCDITPVEGSSDDTERRVLQVTRVLLAEFKDNPEIADVAQGWQRLINEVGSEIEVLRYDSELNVLFIRCSPEDMDLFLIGINRT